MNLRQNESDPSETHIGCGVSGDRQWRSTSEYAGSRILFKYKKIADTGYYEGIQSLAEENDIIVVEGAGSPAEINLKSEDIVNMGLAKLLKAPVLLAGDIDRGGVFAQLAGTMMLLEKEEQQMVKGLIINKFRGDKRILDPGIEMLKDYTPVPVVGLCLICRWISMMRTVWQIVWTDMREKGGH